MGQAEVYDFLKVNRGKEYTSKELEKALNVSSVHYALNRLLKADDIIRTPHPDKKYGYVYSYNAWRAC